MECIIFVGIQATGKSTFCREHFFRTHMRINLDMLRTCHRDHDHVVMIKMLLRHEYGLKLYCVEGFSEDDDDSPYTAMMEQMLAVSRCIGWVIGELKRGNVLSFPL